MLYGAILFVKIVAGAILIVKTLVGAILSVKSFKNTLAVANLFVRSKKDFNNRCEMRGFKFYLMLIYKC